MYFCVEWSTISKRTCAMGSIIQVVKVSYLNVNVIEAFVFYLKL